MRVPSQILEKAKNSPREFDGVSNVKGDGEYNTGYLLSHEQVYMASWLKVSEACNISINDAIGQYYIDGISTEGNSVNFLDKNIIQEFFSGNIDRAIESAQQGKPAFIVIDDSKHFVVSALVADPLDNSKLSVVYVNSVPEERDSKVSKEEPDGDGFFYDEDSDEVISYNEVSDKKVSSHAKTGKSFCQGMLNYIKDKEGVGLKSEEVLDMSYAQQYDNCCGLSVATNIASIASHFAKGNELATIGDSLFKPASAQEMLDHYKTLGSRFFKALDNAKLDLDKPYESEVKFKEKQPEKSLIDSEENIELGKPHEEVHKDAVKSEEKPLYNISNKVKDIIAKKEEQVVNDGYGIKAATYRKSSSHIEELASSYSKDIVFLLFKNSGSTEEFITQLDNMLKPCIESDFGNNKELLEEFKKYSVEKFNKYHQEVEKMGVIGKFIDKIKAFFGQDTYHKFIENISEEFLTEAREIFGKYTNAHIKEKANPDNIRQI